ncbi:MAG: F0F1 ATP synthase subunit A [Candidatus Pacebacteria bacterium]|nr:F0F1 ATP synthase subunit A [Candidatus Paceibacterota bacterium]
MHEGIHIALKSEVVTHLFGVPVTNTLLMSWLTIGCLVLIAYFVGRRLTKIPSHLQTFFETLFGFILDYMEEVLESRSVALRFFPLITTLFMFILLGNWFGLLPGVGSIYVHESHAEESTALSAGPLFTGEQVSLPVDPEGTRVALLHPVSTDLNMTLALAIVSFLVIEVSGVLFIGFRAYAGKFLNFSSPISFFVGIIEFISELVRLVSFSFRLFGNMFAGKTLILVAMFFFPLVLPVPLMLYEVLVGFVQAAIFALLTLFFIKIAVSHAH